MTKIPTGHLITRLRALFNSNYTPTQIHAYVVLSNDCHMSEYTSSNDQRRKFISGFGGSSGSAVVTLDSALLWTDGRYFLEAESCLDENWTLMKYGLPEVASLIDWLTTLPEGCNIGTDPAYIPYVDWKSYKKILRKHGKNLLPIKENLIDVVWNEHGKKPEILSKPFVYRIQFSGVSWHEKIDKIRQQMKLKHSEILVLSALDEIAWLFNLRGSDIDYCPVFKSFCLLSLTDIYLFIDEERLTSDVLDHLNVNKKAQGLSVILMPYSSVVMTLKELSKTSKNVWINSQTPAFIAMEVSKDKLLIERNPVVIAKSIKNSTELSNLKLCCIKDAACLCEFFGYLEHHIKSNKIDEVEASEYLTSIRSKKVNYISDSFPTISSVGSNSAIIHYHPSPETSKVITDKEIYLCDSGAQYLDGTTDITRTLHFGNPTDLEKECYTQVLKGHIAIASVSFPKECKGSRLDSFARHYLWNVGLDYLHGTGHGIGMCLNVHEGPQRISFGSSDDHKLEVGNLLSNEPGYYEDGKFGIRIENMITVVPTSLKYNFKNIGFFGFETLSHIPMHRSLIDPSLLSKQEIEWLNTYHEKCVSLLSQELENNNFKFGLEYLKKNTIPFN